MNYLLQMREFLQYVAERKYDARYIYRLEDKNNMLESLRLEAEGVSRCSGKTIYGVFLSCENIVHILNDEVKDVFRHISSSH